MTHKMDLKTADAAQKITVAVATSSKSTKWKNKTLTEKALIKRLTDRRVRKDKNGACYIQGELIADQGRRQTLKIFNLSI